MPSLDQPFYRDEHLFVHLRRQVVMLDGQLITLTPTQYRLLALLVENAGDIVPRATFLMEIWRSVPELSPRQVDLHIDRLRRKLGVYAEHHIETVPEVGYRFQSASPRPLDLTAIVQASDDAIIGKTLDGTIVSWNRGAERIYGYRAEEILGQPISVLMPPGQPGEFFAIVKRLRRGQHIQSYETTRVHKDGHAIDVSVTISPVKNKAGKVVGASVVARDITSHKQAEAALRLSEERLRVALKHAPVVVFTQDLQLRYTWITPPVMAWDYRNLLGRTDAESCGAWDLRSFVGCTDAEIFGEERGERLTALKEEVLRTGVESRTEVTLTFEGVTRYFDLVVEPFRDARGTLLGLTCSGIDTTPWKYLIANLKEALDQVQLLSGLLPICASCKRIKDEREVWQPLESYIQAHSEAKFSHGVCPDCLRKLYPEYY